MANLSRRRFVLASGATAIATWLTPGCSIGSNLASDAPGTTADVNINSADVPETAAVQLGFISLTDYAPLVMANSPLY